MNILKNQVKKMGEEVGRTIDDEIRYMLMVDIYIKGLPLWASKLSKKRHHELLKSIHRIVMSTK